MQHVFLVVLLGICSVLARPSADVQYLIPADYKLLTDALRLDQEIEREIYRRLSEDPRQRLRRKVSSVAIPIKRISRIGGNIVMGRKK
ncbi:hypothetical protein Y032_0004g1893 [Ancylostoma ceylanicum]|uniref:Uncharacterized protein n=1 Tax=Ancylostoma ceylanicum TaxID=53326 RepID=A0A016VTU1_9BILA|nr:hypothetical protein Y032_0004g1893 [Ancylostoma ceylanicum]